MATEKDKKELKVVEYEANGEIVKLSTSMIKKYLVSGGGNVTDQEVMMFLSLCRYQHLNPFLKDAYLVKYGSSPAAMVTGKEVFTKRANATPNYEGKEAGVIVVSKDGNLIEREGCFVLDSETLVGGWARVHIKGRNPEYQSVAFNEYAGRKKDGTLNSQWAGKPATMIRKVAVVQALREAFPETFQGLYAQEEMAEASDVQLDAQEIVAKEIVESANSVEFEESATDEIEVEVIEGKAVESDGSDVETEEDVPDFMKG